MKHLFTYFVIATLLLFSFSSSDSSASADSSAASASADSSAASASADSSAASASADSSVAAASADSSASLATSASSATSQSVVITISITELIKFFEAINPLGGVAEKDVAATDKIAATDPRFLTSAKFDECFFGQNSELNRPLGSALKCLANDGELKTNDAYPWSIVVSKYNRVFVGTIPNALCLLTEQILGAAFPQRQQSFEAETSNLVCEGLRSDQRPPNLLLIDVQDEFNVKIIDLSRQLPPYARKLRAQTIGFRSAGTLGDVTFIAGTNLDTVSINVFAFHSKSGNFLGARRLSIGGDARKWIVINGALFVGTGAFNGIGTQSTYGPSYTGSIYRWDGELSIKEQHVSDDAASPYPQDISSSVDQDHLFAFHCIVDNLSGLAAELVVHRDRLYVHTWRGRRVGDVAGLFVSHRPIYAKNFGGARETFRCVFNYSDYEPDPFALASYSGGAMASYKGKLYFGTIHVPFGGFLLWLRANAASNPSRNATIRAALTTWRATQLFRWEDPTDPATIPELLYGGSVFFRGPLSLKALGGFFLSDGTPAFNRLGVAPIFGAAGFEWPFNSYTWSMIADENDLYIGTFDSSVIFADARFSIVLPTLPPIIKDFAVRNLNVLGADLWRFYDPQQPPVYVSKDGFGNRFNYGIRNLVNFPGKGIIAGMANPFNLAGPDGGWELWLLRKGEVTSKCFIDESKVASTKCAREDEAVPNKLRVGQDY